MRIAVLHLSDIHLKAVTDPIVGLAENISEAISPISVTNPDACLLIISGDLANKGLPEEYEVASTFIEKIVSSTSKRFPGIDLKIAIVPGNHDCYFGDDQSVRNLVLDRVIANSGTLPEKGILAELTKPLANFKKFISDSNVLSLDFTSNLLNTKQVVSFSGFNINLLLLNSPWLSREKEQIGTHFFPQSALEHAHVDSELTFAVIHHHPSWFGPTYRRNLHSYVDAAADILFTGHEHQTAIYMRSRINEELSVIHAEGGVLQEKGDVKNSSFNILLIDTDSKSVLCNTVHLRDGQFSPVNTNANWQSLTRNSRGRAHSLPFTSLWERDLDDLGTKFTHRHKDLTFSDLYVPPNLSERKLDGHNRDTSSTAISSERLPQFIASEKHAIIIGEESSGKSSLIKYWTNVLKRQGLYPIVIKGEDITGSGENNVTGVLKRNIAYQYGDAGVEDYMRLMSSQRFLMLDDFHLCSLNYESKDKVLGFFEKFSDHVLIFSDEMWELTDWSVNTALRDRLGAYKTIEIMPFGHHHREKLIRNWLTAGNPENLTEDELVRQTHEHKRMVDVLLGKNLLPMYPFFILAYLQQMEAGAPVHTIVGSHGYLYASLINRSLDEVSHGAGIDTDTYLSLIAGEVLLTDVFKLSRARIEAIHAEYCEKYHLPITSERLLRTLVNAGLLHEDAIGYSFKYRYIYYYFAAKYLSDHMFDLEIKARVDNLIDSLHKEDSGNIVIFISYLNKDSYILDRVLAKAKTIYASVKPCDFDKDVEFIGALQKQIPAVVLHQKSLIQARDELNQAQDEAEERFGPKAAANYEKAKNELGEILELNQSLKTIQILGQIIRNSMGSLIKQPKYDAAEAVYYLGLRTVNAYFWLLNKHLDQVVSYVEGLIDKSIVDKAVRAEQAREVVAWLTELFGASLIKRVAQAIGHEQLRLTFQDVLENNRNTAVEIIDLAIKLDHYKEFPQQELQALIDKTKGNLLSRVVIRNLTLMRFYILPTPHEIKERFCKKLGIEIVKVRQLEHKTKQEKK